MGSDKELYSNYEVDQGLLRSNAIKLQSIGILFVILISVISAIYFYYQLQQKNIALNLTIEQLTDTQNKLKHKEQRILAIQDSLFTIMGKLNLLNEDSAFLIQARELVQASNNITLSAEASSYLPPSEYNTYFPENVVDGIKSTPWVEGVEGYGDKEFIQINFNKRSTIKGIRILNGYNYVKSDGVGNRFFKNSRVEQATLRFSDGSEIPIILEDNNEFQTFTFPEKTTDYVILVIESAYKGTKWDDTCISEINFIFKL